MQVQTPNIDSVNFTYSGPEYHPVQRGFIRLVETLSGQLKLKKLYENYIKFSDDSDFFDASIESLDLDVKCLGIDLAKIPSEGPLIFVANHPYGVLDGIVLTWLARKIRPDVKILANKVLCQAPSAAENLLPVDFAGTNEALQTNLTTRREALRIAINGGAIGIFPGGGVGASEKPLSGPALDPAWHPFTAKLIRKSGATVVPIYFAGQNSRLFQIASHLSYTLRLSLFFFETARRIGSELELVIGKPIPFKELETTDNREDLLKELRCKTFQLAAKTSKNNKKTDKGLPDYNKEYVYPRHFDL